jgi:hypothetical protein
VASGGSVAPFPAEVRPMRSSRNLGIDTRGPLSIRRPRRSRFRTSVAVEPDRIVVARRRVARYDLDAKPFANVSPTKSRRLPVFFEDA